MVVNVQMTKQRIVILGSSGMLGSALTRYFSQEPDCLVTGTVRSKKSIGLLPQNLQENIVWGIDAINFDTVREFIKVQRPNIVINCVGLVKQLSDANDPLIALPINSLFPHMLARCCAEYSARLVHMSTDCVFNGSKGGYLDDDIPDALDLYGVSKRLGEVDYTNAITLRTSIIGHELDGSRSLVDWFLSQKESVKGFSKAVFSGLPTVEMARIIKDYVIPNEKLHGVYHVSADPINKYDLLKLLANIYGHDTKVIRDVKFIIDRSLNSSRFRDITGFKPVPWDEMVTRMKNFG